MDIVLGLRVLAGAAIDASLATLTGLLLARLWLLAVALKQEPGSELIRPTPLWVPALVLLLGLCAQLLLLSVTFSGETSLHGILAALPDVFSTHAGEVTGLTIATAGALLCVTLLGVRTGTLPLGCAALLIFCLVLRSANGHAATDGDFSVYELLQLLHLTGMSLWSGGVLVSGLLVVPRLASLQRQSPESGVNGPSMQELDARALATRAYLDRLSRLSAWALLTVILTGVLKGYNAVGGRPRLLGHSAWGYILMTKIAFVGAAIMQGALNRFRLGSATPWHAGMLHRVVRSLRIEAWLMVAVLVLSAWLGNMAPPET
jgi:putative copper resistance protein D